MRNILTFLFAIYSTILFAQSPKSETDSIQPAILKTFITQLADPNVAVDVIISQHMIVEEPSNDLYDYLEVSLDEIRLNLMSKKIEEIEYIPFSKMALKEIKDIDIENLDANNIYFLYYKKRQVVAIYLENNKIASITLVAKGDGKAHFVLY